MQRIAICTTDGNHRMHQPQALVTHSRDVPAIIVQIEALQECRLGTPKR